MGTGYTKMKIIEELLQQSLFIGNSSEWTIRHTCSKEKLVEKLQVEQYGTWHLPIAAKP